MLPVWGWACPQLILKTSSGGRWGRRLGLFSGKGIDDGVWGTFQLAVTFTEAEVGPLSNNACTSLSISGLGENVKQSIDNFLLELAPPATPSCSPMVMQSHHRETTFSHLLFREAGPPSSKRMATLFFDRVDDMLITID